MSAIVGLGPMAAVAILVIGPFQSGADTAIESELPNVALGKPASASSVEEGLPLGTADRAVDGDPETRMSTAYADEQWLEVDLGAPHNVSRVAIHWETAYASAYTIEMSDDRNTWTQAYATTTGDGELDDLTGLEATGRYIRLVSSDRGSPWGVSPWEFEVYGEPVEGRHAQNISEGKPTRASSVEPWLLDATGDMAVDGDRTTRWASDYADDQSLQIDLGAAHVIDRVAVHWETAFASGYRIETSDDADTWTEVRAVVEGDGGADHLMDLGITGRYVRLVSTDRGTPWGVSAYEVEVYGWPVDGDDPTTSPAPAPPTTVAPPTTAVPPTTTAPPSAGSCPGLIQEAESVELTGAFVVVEDADASGGAYVSTAPGTVDPPPDSTARYCFNVPTAGEYVLMARVERSRGDSFFVTVPGGTATVWPFGTGDDWMTRPVRFDGEAVELDLAAGDHEFVFAAREVGTRLDRVMLLPTYGPMLRDPDGGGCLTVDGTATLAPCDLGPGQEIGFAPTSDGYGTLTLASGQCLTMEGGSREPGAAIVAADCGDGAPFEWAPVDSFKAEDRTEFRSRHSNLCITGDDGTATVTQQFCKRGDHNHTWATGVGRDHIGKGAPATPPTDAERMPLRQYSTFSGFVGPVDTWVTDDILFHAPEGALTDDIARQWIAWYEATDKAYQAHGSLVRASDSLYPGRRIIHITGGPTCGLGCGNKFKAEVDGGFLDLMMKDPMDWSNQGQWTLYYEMGRGGPGEPWQNRAMWPLNTVIEPHMMAGVTFYALGGDAGMERGIPGQILADLTVWEQGDEEFVETYAGDEKKSHGIMSGMLLRILQETDQDTLVQILANMAEKPKDPANATVAMCDFKDAVNAATGGAYNERMEGPWGLPISC
ncbi:MAG: discoidin domain-containing protein [Actinomycetota bacterium]